MNCYSVETVLDLYVEARLTPGRARTVEDHLRGCGACRGRIEGYRISSGKIKAPAGLKDRLKALAGDSSPRVTASALPNLFSRENAPVFVAFFAAAALSWVFHSAGIGVPSQRHLPLPQQQEDI